MATSEEKVEVDELQKDEEAELKKEQKKEAEVYRNSFSLC